MKNPTFSTVKMKFLVALWLLMSIGNIQVLTLSQDNTNEVAIANNKFALKLHKTFNASGNAFSSPLSVFTALGMLYAGARGSTRAEMRQALSYDSFGSNQRKIGKLFRKFLLSLSGASDNATVKIANALLSQNTFPVSEKYRRFLNKNYDAVIKEVDFLNDADRAVDEINDWIRNKTEGKITKLLESLESDTVLALLNAVYFKAKWEIPFDTEYITEEQFFNNGVEEVTVPLMFMEDYYSHGHFEEYGLQAIKLLYAGSEFSMVVLLPDDRDGLSGVENRLTVSILDDILSRLEEKNVIIRLPKFKLEDSRKLKESLKVLGIRRAFTDMANFQGIVEPDLLNDLISLKVSDVVHKTVVDVTQYGTEAAGATYIGISARSYVETVHFLVKHPFLFFIRHEVTGAIMFFGRVNQL